MTEISRKGEGSQHRTDREHDRQCRAQKGSAQLTDTYLMCQAGNDGNGNQANRNECSDTRTSPQPGSAEFSGQDGSQGKHSELLPAEYQHRADARQGDPRQEDQGRLDWRQ